MQAVNKKAARSLAWARVLMSVVVVLWTGCGGRSDKKFVCYKTADGWRECAPTLSRCAERGCFDRIDAYCFPYDLHDFASEKVTKGLICSPTEDECKAWHADRAEVINRATGPCFKARADEYPSH